MSLASLADQNVKQFAQHLNGNDDSISRQSLYKVERDIAAPDVVEAFCID